MTALSQRKHQLTQFIQHVWNEGEVDTVGNYVADSYTIHHDPGDPWEGKTLDLRSFKDRVWQSRAPFPDQKFDIQGLFADGAGVAMTWLWRGTHLGEIAGFPATGRTIRMSGATIYMFDGQHRLTGHWQISDRLSVFQQLQTGKQHKIEAEVATG
jgi:steroid delta-isomerase-like uncharacterized protein